MAPYVSKEQSSFLCKGLEVQGCILSKCRKLFTQATPIVLPKNGVLNHTVVKRVTIQISLR